jgi:FMN-dependent NADH-azoreductase
VTILHIDSSISGENSASRRLTESIVGRVRRSNWGEEVVYRDLAAEPLPHPTFEAFGDTAVLDEFLAADTIVIGAPMYNFGVLASLAWFDRIAIAGTLTPKWPGRVGRRQRVIALARGGFS